MEFGDEEEIELSLGLGIGGSCKKRARSEDRMREVPARGGAEGKEGEEVDLARRREMQALRRQEARRKREEKKQMKRGGLRVVRRSLVNQQVDNGGRSVVYDGGNVDDVVDDVVALKREKIESDAAEGADQSSQFLQSENPAPACSSSAYAFPIYAYPSFQYVPFAFPCIAPVYRPESDATVKTAAEQTVSFRPFLGGAATVNGVKDEVNVTAISNGSVGCCSSAISENRSISSQDGSSSDSGSHRSDHKSAKRELHSSSGSDAPDGAADKADNAPPTTLFQTSSAKVRTQDTSAVEPKPANIPISRTTSLPQPKTPITKDNKVDSNSPGKPPRPVHNQEPRAAPSQMPCVSTTGNGPDGKTITGFLYRYSTTAEVSIVCVCHGESFSPAEFVKHAGGIDIIHPLRHITVVPSAF